MLTVCPDDASGRFAHPPIGSPPFVNVTVPEGDTLGTLELTAATRLTVWLAAGPAGDTMSDVVLDAICLSVACPVRCGAADKSVAVIVAAPTFDDAEMTAV